MAKRSTVLTAVSLTVIAGVFAALYVQAIFGGPKGADPSNADQVARGETVYGENCAACHGKNLEGQPNWRVRGEDGILPAPPHDETGHTWHHADKLLFDITKRGGQAVAPPSFKSGMPAFGETLSDGDIWAVLAFIKSRWPEAARKRQEMMNKAQGN